MIEDAWKDFPQYDWKEASPENWRHVPRKEPTNDEIVVHNAIKEVCVED
jgi:hypothetical protein